jgi:hypothetical protein
LAQASILNVNVHATVLREEMGYLPEVPGVIDTFESVIPKAVLPDIL